MPITEYNENSIQVLEGLEAVRKRPGMYIGSTDYRGLHHLVWEIVDNAVDEALNGFGNIIEITIEKDNVICVKDSGRGMPVGINKTMGVSTLAVIFTKLHAGGKFTSQGGYKTAGGLHGVGASVVNALSEWVDVRTFFNGKEYTMRFENGGKVTGKLIEVGPTKNTGSIVRFKADSKIFGDISYNFSSICERARETAFLMSNIKIVCNDERDDKHEVFHYEEGLKAFLEYLHQGHTTITEAVSFSGTYRDISVDFAFQYRDNYTEECYSFVNQVRTKDGGTHEMGYKSAFTKVFNDFARTHGILKEKDKNLEGSDVREGLTAIVSCSIPENLLQFEGQTKGKLGTPDARIAVENIVGEQLGFYLNEHKETGELIVEKIIRASKAREAARIAREEARKGKKNNKLGEKLLSGNLSAAHSNDSKRSELFIVEGESAGGSAKKGRDSKYQAILPIRGKSLNTERVDFSKVEKNVEFNTLIYAIGAGVGDSFDYEISNYNKVIIMTDADTDGAHIQILLLTFFYNYMRPLIEQGKVYIAIPPLYKVQKGKEFHYAYTNDELLELQAKMGKVEIQRYKGLGEMNADQLWDTTMNPEHRTLLQVTIENALQAQKTISTLMGKDENSIRKEWITNNVSFVADDYILKGDNNG